MKGQKRCYSVRSKVTLTVIKLFGSSFSHSLPSQAQTRSCSVVGRQEGREAPGIIQLVAGISETPVPAREGAPVQQLHQRTELSYLCTEQAHTCVPHSFSFFQLHPLELASFWGVKSVSGSLSLISVKVAKLTELSILKYMWAAAVYTVAPGCLHIYTKHLKTLLVM